MDSLFFLGFPWVLDVQLQRRLFLENPKSKIMKNLVAQWWDVGNLKDPGSESE